MTNSSRSDEISTGAFKGSRQSEILDVCTQRMMRQEQDMSEEAEIKFYRMLEKVLRRMINKESSVIVSVDDAVSSNRILKLTPSTKLRKRKFGKDFC